jgi:hypothetical protein
MCAIFCFRNLFHLVTRISNRLGKKKSVCFSLEKNMGTVVVQFPQHPQKSEINSVMPTYEKLLQEVSNSFGGELPPGNWQFRWQSSSSSGTIVIIDSDEALSSAMKIAMSEQGISQTQALVDLTIQVDFVRVGDKNEVKKLDDAPSNENA